LRGFATGQNGNAAARRLEERACDMFNLKPRDERGDGIYIGGGVLLLILIVLVLILIF
jgi:hypothetical protein